MAFRSEVCGEIVPNMKTEVVEEPIEGLFIKTEVEVKSEDQYSF